MVIGKLSMHRDGYGFVTPDPSAIDERLKARLSGDVFIPPPAVGSAMHGDRVLVEVGAFRPDGRAEGRVLRTVNRAHPTVVGIFHYGRRQNYVTPIDQKVAQEIVIPPGWENPENLLTKEATENTKEKPQRKIKSVDRVLGEQVVRRLDSDNLDNVVVDVEITDWPSATQNPRGRVTEILGYEDDFGVDVEMIIRKFHLPHHFPAEVLEEAQNALAVIPSAEIKRRRDFRQVISTMQFLCGS
jgi:ribonuclease R